MGRGRTIKNAVRLNGVSEKTIDLVVGTIRPQERTGGARTGKIGRTDKKFAVGERTLTRAAVPGKGERFYTYYKRDVSISAVDL